MSSSDGTPLYKIVPTGPAVNPAIQPRNPVTSFSPSQAPVVPQQQHYHYPAAQPQPVQPHYPQPVQPNYPQPQTAAPVIQPQPVVSVQPLPPVQQVIPAVPAVDVEQPRQFHEVKPSNFESIVSTSKPLVAVSAVPTEPAPIVAVEERSETEASEPVQDQEVGEAQTIEVTTIRITFS